MIRSKQKLFSRLKLSSYSVRKIVLDISYQAHIGHIGSALSIADILTVLYHHVLHVDPKTYNNPTRDRFILSKGHAAAAFYAVLYQRGFLSHKKLMSFCLNNGALGVHPDYDVQAGIECTTGSLGHGLSIGAGMALGMKKLQVSSIKHHISKKTPYVYVLLSDAELNEGSTWEAIMFAAHHRLNNLTAIIDVNGQQAFGKTKDVLHLGPLAKKFKDFGWLVKHADGHNIESLLSAFSDTSRTSPTVILAQTHAGYGVKFMQQKIDWHYWPMTKEQYEQACKDIERTK